MSTINPTELRPHLHGMWSAVAPNWAQYAEDVDARSTAVTERMLAATAPARGERVLELACGPGGLGLAAARLVAPGEAVLSDVAPEMIEIAARRAGERGLDNVSVRVLDLESIDEPDDSFDVVLCREGLMFALDPATAAAEIRRVLLPGGRFAVAAWGPRDRNPWLGLVMDAVSAELGAPVPPPGIPGPFALSDCAALAELLGATVVEHEVQMGAGSVDAWWTRTCALAGPLSKILESLPEPTVSGIRNRLDQAVEPYLTEKGVELPGVTLIASGTA